MSEEWRYSQQVPKLERFSQADYPEDREPLSRPSAAYPTYSSQPYAAEYPPHEADNRMSGAGRGYAYQTPNYSPDFPAREYGAPAGYFPPVTQPQMPAMPPMPMPYPQGEPFAYAPDRAYQPYAPYPPYYPGMMPPQPTYAAPPQAFYPTPQVQPQPQQSQPQPPQVQQPQVQPPHPELPQAESAAAPVEAPAMAEAKNKAAESEVKPQAVLTVPEKSALLEQSATRKSPNVQMLDPDAPFEEDVTETVPIFEKPQSEPEQVREPAPPRVRLSTLTADELLTELEARHDSITGDPRLAFLSTVALLREVETRQKIPRVLQRLSTLKTSELFEELTSRREAEMTHPRLSAFETRELLSEFEVRQRIPTEASAKEARSVKPPLDPMALPDELEVERAFRTGVSPYSTMRPPRQMHSWATEPSAIDDEEDSFFAMPPKQAVLQTCPPVSMPTEQKDLADEADAKALSPEASKLMSHPTKEALLIAKPKSLQSATYTTPVLLEKAEPAEAYAQPVPVIQEEPAAAYAQPVPVIREEPVEAYAQPVPVIKEEPAFVPPVQPDPIAPEELAAIYTPPVPTVKEEPAEIHVPFVPPVPIIKEEPAFVPPVPVEETEPTKQPWQISDDTEVEREAADPLLSRWATEPDVQEQPKTPQSPPAAVVEDSLNNDEDDDDFLPVFVQAGDEVTAPVTAPVTVPTPADSLGHGKADDDDDMGGPSPMIVAVLFLTLIISLSVVYFTGMADGFLSNLGIPSWSQISTQEDGIPVAFLDVTPGTSAEADHTPTIPVIPASPGGTPRIYSMDVSPTTAVAPAELTFTLSGNSAVTGVQFRTDNQTVMLAEGQGTPSGDGTLWEYTVQFDNPYQGLIYAYLSDRESGWIEGGSVHVDVY